jgi:hypothetical protein
MDVPLLKDVLWLSALTIAVLLVCYQLRVATLVGFLITGVQAVEANLSLRDCGKMAKKHRNRRIST